MKEKNESLSTTSTCAPVEEKKKFYVSADADLYEIENGWIIEADLPGASRGDLSIQVDQGVLTLQAEARTGRAGRPFHQEFGPATYLRRFRVGDRVDAEGISAQLVNGVLTLHLPLAEKARPRVIEIKANG